MRINVSSYATPPILSNSMNPPELEELLNSSGKKKVKRHPVHQTKQPAGSTAEELLLTGDVADEELTQVLDDIYAKAGESCKLSPLPSPPFLRPTTLRVLCSLSSGASVHAPPWFLILVFLYDYYYYYVQE